MERRAELTSVGRSFAYKKRPPKNGDLLYAWWAFPDLNCYVGSFYPLKAAARLYLCKFRRVYKRFEGYRSILNKCINLDVFKDGLFISFGSYEDGCAQLGPLPNLACLFFDQSI